MVGEAEMANVRPKAEVPALPVDLADAAVFNCNRV